ncbi:MAG: AAA family ATPase, partial [Candidatus Limisoma sp.]|nr:AAA family ATPase [Candidatus Limisoma sp.]
MAKRFPIGIQDFEGLRRDGYYYVDKTALVYDLANTNKYYFLSRPRRFGKSLLVSTLKAYFLGKKELFEGLAMADLEKDWTTYPVFHIDFVGGVYNNIDDLNERMDIILRRIEEEYNLTPIAKSPAGRFNEDIKQVYDKTKKQVVILIDEYDKPLIDNIDHPEMQARMRDFLSGLYGNLKSMDS